MIFGIGFGAPSFQVIAGRTDEQLVTRAPFVRENDFLTGKAASHSTTRKIIMKMKTSALRLSLFFDHLAYPYPQHD